MEESYIKDYILNLLENTYINDLERLKAIMYGLEDILNRTQYNAETDDEKRNHNRLTTAYLIIQEIVKKEDDAQQLPF